MPLYGYFSSFIFFQFLDFLLKQTNDIKINKVLKKIELQRNSKI